MSGIHPVERTRGVLYNGVLTAWTARQMGLTRMCKHFGTFACIECHAIIPAECTGDCARCNLDCPCKSEDGLC